MISTHQYINIHELLKITILISLLRRRNLEFRGKFPVRIKIVTGSEPTEQVPHFTYLRCDVTYYTSKDIKVNLNKFRHICRTLTRALKNKPRNETQITFYKVMAVHFWMYRLKSWVLNQKEYCSLRGAEVVYLRSVKGCTRSDCLPSEDIGQN